MTRRVIHVVTGPRDHGVVRFGLDLHINLRSNGFAVSLCRHAVPAALHENAPAKTRTGVHIQFTDRLFGGDPLTAASAFVDLAAAGRARGGPVTTTLHDLPQPSDGAHFLDRVRAYGRVAGACDAVVVSSEHERQLLHDNEIEVADVTVIPLPIDRYAAVAASPISPGARSLGVFGFLYPGKGHAEVLAAAADLPPDVEVLAIGAPSAGHDDLAEDLRMVARRQGRRFRVTGHVADTSLPEVLREVTVPIAAHRHISASGSLNMWLAAGRRPLAPANRYTTEIEDRNPGSVALYDDTARGLESAIWAALASPATTWLPTGVAVTPSPDEAANSYADFFHRWAA